MNLAPAVTFAIYIIIATVKKDETLLTSQAFTSIALISLLTNPVVVFIQSLPRVIQCIASFDRIQEYYNYNPSTQAEEKSLADKDKNAKHVSEVGRELGTLSTQSHIVLDGESFAWNLQDQFGLKDLNAKIALGTTTVIMGPVACGKSSFLSCLLGEMISSNDDQSKVLSRKRIMQPLAYCSQEPWLPNVSIRDNIVGIEPYEQNWYTTVEEACCLATDFLEIPAGDLTVVGSKGMNLSGGQKKRIVRLPPDDSKGTIVIH